MRAPSRYDDFRLALEAAEGGGYSSRVTTPTAARAREPFTPPWSLRELDDLLGDDRGRCDRHVVADAPIDRQRPPEAETEGAQREIGGLLFDALFVGSVRESYLLARERATARGRDGLRLRLSIDLDRPGGAELAALPWELLYRRESREFLARHPATPIVRHLETVAPPLPRPPLDGPLRILAVASNPPDTVPLDLAAEVRCLEELGATAAGVEVELLDQPDAGELHRGLRERAPHVLHFMGHGELDEGAGEGALLARGAAGRSEPLPASVLVDSVRASGELRLVVLNACVTARLPRPECDPYGGLAAALVLAGVPAVVGMRRRIADSAAVAFAEAFYRALAATDPVDLATTEGRLAIHRRVRRSPDWATPALYLSVPDAALFESRIGAGAGVTAEGSLEHDSAAARAKYDIDASGASGVIVGDGTRIGSMSFGPRAPGAARKEER